MLRLLLMLGLWCSVIRSDATYHIRNIVAIYDRCLLRYCLHRQQASANVCKFRNTGRASRDACILVKLTPLSFKGLTKIRR